MSPLRRVEDNLPGGQKKQHGNRLFQLPLKEQKGAGRGWREAHTEGGTEDVVRTMTPEMRSLQVVGLDTGGGKGNAARGH